eukprot:g45159.t1
MDRYDSIDVSRPCSFACTKFTKVRSLFGRFHLSLSTQLEQEVGRFVAKNHWEMKQSGSREQAQLFMAAQAMKDGVATPSQKKQVHFTLRKWVQKRCAVCTAPSPIRRSQIRPGLYRSTDGFRRFSAIYDTFEALRQGDATLEEVKMAQKTTSELARPYLCDDIHQHPSRCEAFLPEHHAEPGAGTVSRRSVGPALVSQDSGLLGKEAAIVRAESVLAQTFIRHISRGGGHNYQDGIHWQLVSGDGVSVATKPGTRSGHCHHDSVSRMITWTSTEAQRDEPYRRTGRWTALDSTSCFIQASC